MVPLERTVIKHYLEVSVKVKVCENRNRQLVRYQHGTHGLTGSGAGVASFLTLLYTGLLFAKEH